MWQLASLAKYDRRLREFNRKHSLETAAVLANLAKYMGALNITDNPLMVKYGFIHTEGMGVVAIDQSGGEKKLKQTRLYLYAETETKTVHLITLGDKRSQPDDVQECHEYIKFLRKGG
jgi:hypothetical protein